MNLYLIFILVANVMVSLKAFDDPYFFKKYEFNIGQIKQGSHYRMFTSAFLHVDLSHLAFNMLTLYFFAPTVLTQLDDFKFLIIYFGSLLAGNIFTLSFHKNDFHYRAVGASGAVIGVLYAAILLDSNLVLNFFFIPIDIPAYLFGIGYLLYTLYGMKNNNDLIGHSAHFGGAIGGFLITLAQKPSLFWEETAMIGLLCLPILILFILIKTGKIKS